MVLYKRKAGGHWWVRFAVRGRTVRRSSGTEDRQKAEEFETALRDRFWRAANLGEAAYTWREAVIRYKRESNWRESTRTRNLFALQYFERLNSVPVGAINLAVITAARDAVAREQGIASTNRIMAVFRSILHACARWGWITHAPAFKFPKLPPREFIPPTPAEFQRLIAELPEHKRKPAVFAAATGLRDANIRNLKWSQVDIKRKHMTIAASQYKTNRTIGLPLSDLAVRILESIPRESAYVFTYKGKPMANAMGTKAFRKARARAKMPEFRWHDFRHTFASWLAISGASDRVLQSLGGWSSARMVERYAHLRSEDTRAWTDAVGTNMVTPDVLKIAQVLVPQERFELPTHALRMLRPRRKA